MRFTVALFAFILNYLWSPVLGYLMPPTPPSIQQLVETPSTKHSTIDSIKSLTDFDSLDQIISNNNGDILNNLLEENSLNDVTNNLISYDKIPNAFEDNKSPATAKKDLRVEVNADPKSIFGTKMMTMTNAISNFRPKGLKQITLATGIATSYFIGLELSKAYNKRIQMADKAASERKKREKALALIKEREEILARQAKEAKKIASYTFSVLVSTILMTQIVRATKSNDFFKGSRPDPSPTAQVATIDKLPPPPSDPPTPTFSEPSPVAPEPSSSTVITEDREVVNEVNKEQQEKVTVPSLAPLITKSEEALAPLITKTEESLVSVKEAVIPFLEKYPPQTWQIVALATGISATYFLTEQYQNKKDTLSSTSNKIKMGQKTLEEITRANKKAEEEELQLIAAQRASARVLERKLQAAREEERRIAMQSSTTTATPMRRAPRSAPTTTRSRLEVERQMDRERSAKAMNLSSNSPSQSMQPPPTSTPPPRATPIQKSTPRNQPPKIKSLASRMQEERQMERERRQKANQMNMNTGARNNMNQVIRQTSAPPPMANINQTPMAQTTTNTLPRSTPRMSISSRLQEERQSDRERKARAQQRTSSSLGTSSIGQSLPQNSEIPPTVTPVSPNFESQPSKYQITNSLSNRFQQERRLDAERKAKAKTNQQGTTNMNGVGFGNSVQTPMSSDSRYVIPSAPAPTATRNGMSRSQQERQMENERKNRARMQY